MRWITMVAGAVLVTAGAGGAAAQQQVSETRSASADGSVEVHATDGQVRVVGWDRNEVRVTGTLNSPADRLEVENEEGMVVVRVVRRDGEHHGNSGGNLEIRIPARSDLELHSTSADASVTGVHGSTEVNTVSGSITISGGRADEVTAATRSGEVNITAQAERVEAVSVSGSVRVGGTVSDRVEATSVSGEVTVDASAGQVEASSVSGGVTVRSMRGRAELNSVSGDLRITGRNLSGSMQTVSGGIVLVGDLDSSGTLELTSHSGDVLLQLSPGASLSLEAGTFSGGIEADYPGARVTRVSRREARVQVGSGSTRVEVHTFSGSVKLSGR
jgi:DUF4097 and DUF4098 domain-containing protein YvlB